MTSYDFYCKFETTTTFLKSPFNLSSANSQFFFSIEVATKRQILDLSRHTVWGWGGAPLGKSKGNHSRSLGALCVHRCALHAWLFAANPQHTSQGLRASPQRTAPKLPQNRYWQLQLPRCNFKVCLLVGAMRNGL